MQRLLVVGAPPDSPGQGGWWRRLLDRQLEQSFEHVHAPTIGSLSDDQIQGFSHVLAVGGPGLYEYIQAVDRLADHRSFFYSTLGEPGPLGVPPRFTGVAAPTQAQAEYVGRSIGQSVRVIELGSPRELGYVRYDPRKREFGAEELRQAFFPQVPAVDRLYGLQVDQLTLSELSTICATFGQMVDHGSWQLLLVGPYDRPSIDQLAAANGLEDRLTYLPETRATDVQLFNALDILILQADGMWSAELAMSCGCVPAVVDDQFWADRVGSQRGIELPCFQLALNQEIVRTVFDPAGAAQVLRQINRTELLQRRLNCVAWSRSAAVSELAMGAAWRQFIS